ncbi:MAG: hypothetical protein ACYDH5_11775 [Acidimicrobiales bacterium]
MGCLEHPMAMQGRLAGEGRADRGARASVGAPVARNGVPGVPWRP